jgi:hypothetical protein
MLSIVGRPVLDTTAPVRLDDVLNVPIETLVDVVVTYTPEGSIRDKLDGVGLCGPATAPFDFERGRVRYAPGFGRPAGVGTALAVVVVKFVRGVADVLTYA